MGASTDTIVESQFANTADGEPDSTGLSDAECPFQTYLQDVGEYQKALFAKVSIEPEARITLLDKPGWHGAEFYLPSTAVSADKVEFRLNPRSGKTNSLAFACAGNLRGWQKTAELLAYSPHAVFGMCVALGGPLLRPLGVETCGVHAYDTSGQGKKHDKREVFRAAAAAQGIADWVLALTAQSEN